jgi:hypothetical protein
MMRERARANRLKTGLVLGGALDMCVRGLGYFWGKGYTAAMHKRNTINGISYWMGSALIPGWGQMAQGCVSWGLLLLAAWIVLLCYFREYLWMVYAVAILDALFRDLRTRRRQQKLVGT